MLDSIIEKLYSLKGLKNIQYINYRISFKNIYYYGLFGSYLNLDHYLCPSYHRLGLYHLCKIDQTILLVQFLLQTGQFKVHHTDWALLLLHPKYHMELHKRPSQIWWLSTQLQKKKPSSCPLSFWAKHWSYDKQWLRACQGIFLKCSAWLLQEIFKFLLHSGLKAYSGKWAFVQLR